MLQTALRMLLGDKVKFLGLVLGVALSTLLICQQVSIFYGLLGRASNVIDDAREVSIWVMDPSVKTIDVAYPMKDTELSRVRGVPGVEWAVPFYKSTTQLRTRSGDLESAFIMGIDDATLVGMPDDFLLGNIEDLAQPDTIALNPAGYRLLFPGQELQLGQELEINDRRAKIAGIVDVFPAFSSNLLVYTRYSEALEYTNNGRNTLSFVLASPTNPSDLDLVTERISEQTGLKAVSSEDFRTESIAYILSNTGIPASFGTVVFLGVLIGVAIVGLTFNQFIMENIKQYAALKAIGVGGLRLLGMTLFQAVFVAVVGYGIGLGLAGLFFATAAKNSDGLAGFYLRPDIAIGVAIMSLVMVVVSTVISMRKVLKLDPATVFRG